MFEEIKQVDNKPTEKSQTKQKPAQKSPAEQIEELKEVVKMLVNENSQMSEVLNTIQQEKIAETVQFYRKQQKITTELADAIKELENQLFVEKEDNNLKKEKIE